ncbi:hypothetical protein GGI12_006173, partial [Dipsacomyces acuminosporus]
CVASADDTNFRDDKHIDCYFNNWGLVVDNLTPKLGMLNLIPDEKVKNDIKSLLDKDGSIPNPPPSKEWVRDAVNKIPDLVFDTFKDEIEKEC